MQLSIRQRLMLSVTVICLGLTAMTAFVFIQLAKIETHLSEVVNRDNPAIEQLTQVLEQQYEQELLLHKELRYVPKQHQQSVDEFQRTKAEFIQHQQQLQAALQAAEPFLQPSTAMTELQLSKVRENMQLLQGIETLSLQWTSIAEQLIQKAGSGQQAVELENKLAAVDQ